MSASMLLDSTTGKISDVYLSQTEDYTNITLVAPGTLQFQKTNPAQAEVLSLQTSSEPAQRLTFTNNASPALADIFQTGAMRLVGVGNQGNAPAVVVQGGGTNFSVSTSSGAVPIGVSADSLTLTGLTNVNLGSYPPASANSDTSSVPTIPNNDLFSFVIPVPTGTAVGKKLLLTITLGFTLTPNLAFPAGTGPDTTITLVFVSQSGSHPTQPFPAPVPFTQTSPTLVYPAKFDGTNAPSCSYTITQQQTLVSDGNASWSVGVSAGSPTHTYLLSNATATASLIALA